MATKSEVIRMAMINADSDAINVYDLDYYRSRVNFIQDYEPSRPAGKRLKSDRERVKQEQLRNGNYKDLRS